MGQLYHPQSARGWEGGVPDLFLCLGGVGISGRGNPKNRSSLGGSKYSVFKGLKFRGFCDEGRLATIWQTFFENVSRICLSRR